MTIRLRTVFFIIAAVIIGAFLYSERSFLTPFILAGIFAYLFNPVVNFFTQKVKLHRTLAIGIIYIVLMAIVIIISGILVSRSMDESFELKNTFNNVLVTAKSQVDTLPDWLQQPVQDTLISLGKSKLFSPQYLFTLFPQAISRIISLFIFLFASFYFLKDGRQIIKKMIGLAPKEFHADFEMLIGKIDAVCKGYLRGQLFMIVIVSIVLYIALAILGVKFALILAIFSGFAEIIPIFGPILATIVAAIVVLVSGTANFSLAPLQGIIVVAVIYFVVRQCQDYFLIPHMIGRITKLHPLIVLFAVFVGGHAAGMLGLILAVPVAATIKILFEFSLEKINARSKKSS